MEVKKKDEDPNYGQFSSSLKNKIEKSGDEKSKSLLNKLLKQLKKGESNNEEVIKQLELLGANYDEKSSMTTTRREDKSDNEEPKVPTISDIKMNRKLIRR